MNVGDTFLQYRILSLLGEGGNGYTYLVEKAQGVETVHETNTTSLIVSGEKQPVERELFVLKELAHGFKEGYESYKKGMEMFERECRALRTIHHPLVPRFVESHVDKSTTTHRCFLVSDFVPGETLGSVIKNRQMTLEEITRVALDVTSVLEHTHSFPQPIIHRDIKPENLIFSDDGLVHVIDFGSVNAAVAKSINATRAGTNGYAPWESLFFGNAYPESDVYGLGATLLHLLSGGKDIIAMLDTLNYTLKVRGNVPSDYEFILERMLEKDHSARASVKEVRDFFSRREVVVGELVDDEPVTALQVHDGRGIENLFDGRQRLINAPKHVLVDTAPVPTLEAVVDEEKPRTKYKSPESLGIRPGDPTRYLDGMRDRMAGILRQYCDAALFPSWPQKSLFHLAPHEFVAVKVQTQPDELREGLTVMKNPIPVEEWRLRAEIRYDNSADSEQCNLIVQRDRRSGVKRLVRRRDIFADDVETILEVKLYERTTEDDTRSYLADCTSRNRSAWGFQDSDKKLRRVFTAFSDVPAIAYFTYDGFSYKNNADVSKIVSVTKDDDTEGFFPRLPTALQEVISKSKRAVVHNLEDSLESPREERTEIDSQMGSLTLRRNVTITGGTEGENSLAISTSTQDELSRDLILQNHGLGTYNQLITRLQGVATKFVDGMFPPVTKNIERWSTVTPPGEQEKRMIVEPSLLLLDESMFREVGWYNWNKEGRVKPKIAPVRFRAELVQNGHSVVFFEDRRNWSRRLINCEPRQEEVPVRFTLDFYQYGGVGVERYLVNVRCSDSETCRTLSYDNANILLAGVNAVQREISTIVMHGRVREYNSMKPYTKTKQLESERQLVKSDAENLFPYEPNFYLQMTRALFTSQKAP